MERLFHHLSSTDVRLHISICSLTVLTPSEAYPHFLRPLDLVEFPPYLPPSEFPVSSVFGPLFDVATS